ncbi:hypothetical protein D918_06302 [Trichuris suis]|nr:hypothetical protein D918_06302 [Trichuris suis]
MEEGEIVDDDSDYFNLSDETEECTNVAEQSDPSLECKRLAAQVKRAVVSQDILWCDRPNSSGRKQNYGNDDGKGHQVADNTKMPKQMDSLMVTSKSICLNDLKLEEREEYRIRYWMQRVSKTYGETEFRHHMDSMNDKMSLSKRLPAKSIDETLDESVEKLFFTINKHWSYCRDKALLQLNETEPKSDMMIKWITGSCDPLSQSMPDNVYRLRERPLIEWTGANGSFAPSFPEGRRARRGKSKSAKVESLSSDVSPYGSVQKRVSASSDVGSSRTPMVATTTTESCRTPVTGIEQGPRQFQPTANTTEMKRREDFFHQMGRGAMVPNLASPYNLIVPTQCQNVTTINRSSAPNNLFQNWTHQNQWVGVPRRWQPVRNNHPTVNLRPMAQQANFCNVMQGPHQILRCNGNSMWHNQWPAFPPGQISQQRFLYPPPNYPPWHP